MKITASCLIAALLWMPCPVLADPAVSASDFTPQQRAEIVQIIRDALKSDPTILEDAIVAIQEQEHAHQASASAQIIAQNRRRLFANAGDPVLGNPRGQVTLIEFFDVRCPYCRRMRPNIDRLIAKNPDLRIVMKDLPILGPASVLGSKALLAAQVQGGYAAMLDQLMRDGVTVDLATIERCAKSDGLNWERLHADMSDPRLDGRIDDNIDLAKSLGLHGTPALIYGDQIVPGALDGPDLQKIVDALRSASPATEPPN